MILLPGVKLDETHHLNHPLLQGGCFVLQAVLENLQHEHRCEAFVSGMNVINVRIFPVTKVIICSIINIIVINIIICFHKSTILLSSW